MLLIVRKLTTELLYGREEEGGEGAQATDLMQPEGTADISNRVQEDNSSPLNRHIANITFYIKINLSV